MSRIIHQQPVTDGKPVTGVCPGRMVAYWPSTTENMAGLRAVGNGEYIPAMIVAEWQGRTPENEVIPQAMVTCNLRLFVDGNNVNLAKVHEKLNGSMSQDGCVGSRQFSLFPAEGCWTWMPKA